MKTLTSLIILFYVTTAALVAAQDLSDEQQRQIIENYKYVTGQSTRRPDQMAANLEEETDSRPLKCGMSAAMDFRLNYDRLDKNLLQSTGVQLADRPTNLANSLVSPDNRFRIHYSTIGNSACFNPTVDNDGNGHPDYVDAVADIFDSVYAGIIGAMRYPPPPGDGFYNGGGDGLYDIYLSNLGGATFGLTYMDSATVVPPAGAVGTSYIEIDNDYQELAFTVYNARPLDAVRVTAAHEYFHAVQFGLDFFEAERFDEAIPGRYWMEMSATWMEEQLYDDIDDYYFMIPFFFREPWTSIQRFDNFSDFHPYASVVYPIFLSEKYGADIIRLIWIMCKTLGWGPSFLQAADDAIKLKTRTPEGSTANFRTSFADFGLWNYFTGDRFDAAPAGIGYSEGSLYPMYPKDSMVQIYDYPQPLVQGSDNEWSPEHNGIGYMVFNNTFLLGSDTTFWKFEGLDSTEVTDTLVDPYDVMHIDSLFKVALALGDGVTGSVPTLTEPWGLSVLYELNAVTDSFELDRLDSMYDDRVYNLHIPNARDYKKIIFCFTPATPVESAYRYRRRVYGYFTGGQVVVDSALINLTSTVFLPYPNPAVVSEMDGGLKFSFQIETNNIMEPPPLAPILRVDVYTVAGDKVATLDESDVSVDDSNVGFGKWVLEWNMLNNHNKKVASGVYLAVIQMWSSGKDSALLAKDRAKFVVIR